MGLSGAFRRAICAAALIAVTPSARAANSTTFKLDDGFVNQDGHLEIPVDEYGSFGRLFPASVFDWFQPPQNTPDYPTYLSGAMVFIKSGNDSSAVLLSDQTMWATFLENPPNPDGITGTHAGLARTITTPISGSGASATSAFEISATGLSLKFTLAQSIKTDLTTATSLLDQKYTITNASNVSVDLVFHDAWEVDLYYPSSGTNSYSDDVIGIGPGRCAVYIHNPNSSTIAVAMSNGPATTAGAGTPYYFGGKKDQVPGTGPEPFISYAAPMSQQYVWNQHGMPTSWRDFVVGPGYTGAGDSGTLVADASMGMEWHFTLAPNQTETIDVRRHYGTISVPCGVLASCGNGVIDPGEACEGPDSATCNGATCMASACGDGYPNMAAGEACDTFGIDSDTCNGTSCTAPSCGDGYMNVAAGEQCDDGAETATCTASCLPSSCGDGYVNVVAGEECEGGALCDMASCKVTFTVGGGCAGCSTHGPGSSLWLGAFAFAFTVRRRRRARTA